MKFFARLIKLNFTYLFFLCGYSAFSQFYYGTQQNFDKQRVVFNEFEWNYFRFPQFDVYYYTSGLQNAEYIASIMPEEISKAEKFFGVTLSERLMAVSYNSLSDLKQSNLLENTQSEYDQGGIYNVRQNIVFLYGTGLHRDLREQVRKALTKVFLNYISSGGNLKGKGVSEKNLPEWFVPGIESYYANQQMSAEQKRKIKDAIITKKLRNFRSYDENTQEILGYSIWHFLASRYGNRAVNLIAISSISEKNFKQGVYNVLEIKQKDLEKAWREEYVEGINEKRRKKQKLEPLSGTKVKGKYSQTLPHFALSKDGRLLAYSVNEIGEYKLFIKNLDTGKKKRIKTGGYKIPQNADNSFPVMALSDDNKIFAFAEEDKGFTWLNLYDIDNKENKKLPFNKLQKINSLCFSKNSQDLAISGVSDGYSDIYTYNIPSKALRNITNDSYDDISAKFTTDGSKIVFLSNRTEDTLRSGKLYNLGGENMDIFQIDPKTKEIVRITNTPNIDEKSPEVIEKNKYSYLFENELGNIQINLAKKDSVIVSVDTVIHYQNKITQYEIAKPEIYPLKLVSNSLDGKTAELKYYKKVYNITVSDYLKDSIKTARLLSFEQEEQENEQLKTDKNRQTKNFDFDNYKFEKKTLEKFGGYIPATNSRDTEIGSEISDSLSSNDTIGNNTINRKFFNKHKRLYRNTYYTTSFSAQIDNSYQSYDYQLFTGGPVAPPSALNALFSINIYDKLNDYVYKLGFTTDFRPVWGYSLLANSEIMVGFDNLKKRLNWGVSYYRRSIVQTDEYGYYNAGITNLFKARVVYPLSPVSSIEGSLGFRNDNFKYLSLDLESLKSKNRVENYALLNVAYIYNNTNNFSLNLYRGFKFKIFAELYQGFSKGDQTMINLGFDARYFLRIHKNIVLANRLAYGTSIGNLKLCYFLGGVDNAFLPKFNQNNVPNPKYNWGFQTLSSNVRGFDQNIRYGNSFSIFNTELRIPIFSYLSKNVIRFAPLRHFQVVPFFDAGAAWTALTPWSSENDYNRQELKDGDITVILNNDLAPFIYGYGVGLRTQFFGYFIRTDWAWGVDSGFRFPMRFYFSLGLDF